MCNDLFDINQNVRRVKSRGGSPKGTDQAKQRKKKDESLEVHEIGSSNQQGGGGGNNRTLGNRKKKKSQKGGGR